MAKQNPPPATKAGKTQLAKSKTAVLEVDVQVEVLPDGTMTTGEGQADTSFTEVGNGGNFWRTARFSWVSKKGVETVTKLIGPAEIKGIIRIQTLYGPNAAPTQRSGYGRGTTVPDETAGNTSLGFHESCHRDDFLSYLKKTPLPGFDGKVGMTAKAFREANERFKNAIAQFFARMKKDSFDRTDETGYKKSTYDAKGPRP